MASSRSLRHLSTASAAAAATATIASSHKISISKAKSKLRLEHDPDKALQIYSSVSDYSSPVSSRYAQELTVRRLAKAQRFSDIESFIESHKSDPKIKQEPFLSTLIRSYGRAGMFDHALKTFHEMEQLGTPRTSVSFNALLSACNYSKRFDRVPVLFEDVVLKYGVVPDNISYGHLVKSYCEVGKPEKAVETLREMEKKGMEVSLVVYTTVLDALYKQGKSEEAERLWFEMLRNGFDLDVAAYNVRMMYAPKGDPEKVKEMIEEMGTLGLKPDTISYNQLMTCYFKCGMVEEAKKVYEGLEANACHPNAATFRTMIYYLCKNEEHEKAYRVFKESVRLHKIPDFVSMRNLVEGLVRKKKIKEAKGAIRTVKKKFPPNLVNAWKKVEEELSLNTAKDAAVQEDEDHQEATT